MKKFSILTALLVATCGFSFAQSLATVDAPLVTLRADAITSDVDTLSTFTLPADRTIKGVELYIDFTKGSLTNVIIKPCGAASGNPAASDYYQGATVDNATLTLTASGKRVWYIPYEMFGANPYAAIAVIGTGTVTSSSVGLKYKFVRTR